MKIQLPVLTSACCVLGVQGRATCCIFTPQINSSLKLNWVKVSLSGGEGKGGQQISLKSSFVKKIPGAFLP